jgi:hypothetical protein
MGSPARVLSVLLPLAVLGGASTWLSRTTDEVAPTPEQIDMGRILSERQPGLLVLGNSPAEKNVDLARLTAGLGWDPNHTARLVVPLSRMPVWYAVLRHVVIPHEVTPDLLLVVSTLESMVEAPGAGEAERLWDWMRLVDVEPSSREPLAGDGWSRARGRAARFRRRGLEGVKSTSLRWVYGLEGRAEAESALDRVFGSEGARDVGLRTRVLPVAEGLPDAEVPGVAGVRGEGEHLLTRFLAATGAAGIRVVFVRVPVSPEVPHADQVDRAVEYWARDQLAAAGAGWVDLRSLEIEAGQFDGAVHLHSEGRGIFTDTLIERLETLGAAGAGPLRQSPVPPGPRREP